MADDGRFASISEAEMHEIVGNIDAANTKNQTNTAVRTYLTSKHMSADFESLSKAELDNVLSRFYTELRNEKGEIVLIHFECSRTAFNSVTK